MKSKRTPKPNYDELMTTLVGIWRRFTKLSGPSDKLQTREFRGVVESVKALQSMWKGNESLVGKNCFSDKHLLGAYFLYQTPLHLQEGLSLIGELPQTPKRVLDICAGTAAFSLAALMHGAEEVFALDRSEEALRLGAELVGMSGYSLNVRKWDALKSAIPVEGTFDLIMIGYGLEELFPAEKNGSKEHRRLFVKELLKRLNPNGHLLIVESSRTAENKRLLELRDQMVEEHIAIQAPCVFKGKCPALQMENAPCYAQRNFIKPYLLREIQRGAEINLSSLKMSYIIFKAPNSSWPVLFQNERPSYRVISPPAETYKGKRYYLCGTDGKKMVESHLKEHSKEARAFDFLKRGELISFEDASLKDNTYTLNERSKVIVEAPIGKPSSSA